MLRRLVGGLAVFLGATGFGFFLAALVSVWLYEPRVTRESLEALAQAEEALGNAHREVGVARNFVDTMEDRLGEVSPLMLKVQEIDSSFFADPLTRKRTFAELNDRIQTARRFLNLSRGFVSAGDRSMSVLS
jgi:hypothetical protein